MAETQKPKHPPNPLGKYGKPEWEKELDQMAVHGTDLQWWRATRHYDGLGLCGGCGWETCHPGEPCGDTYSVTHGKRVCDKCQTRRDQGAFPPW